MCGRGLSRREARLCCDYEPLGGRKIPAGAPHFCRATDHHLDILAKEDGMSKFKVVKVVVTYQAAYTREYALFHAHSGATALVCVWDRETRQTKSNTAHGRSIAEAVRRATCNAIGFDLSQLRPFPDDDTGRQCVWVDEVPYCANGPQPMALAEAVVKAADAVSGEGATEDEQPMMAVKALVEEPVAAPVPVPPAGEIIEFQAEGGMARIGGSCSAHR